MPELSTTDPVAPSPATTLLLEASELVEQAYRRASGASRVDGNAVRILKDGAANYAAWFAAIRAARKTVFFENYIIEDDEVGGELAAALIDRAHAGVKVRMLHDWLGSLAGATRRYWRVLVAAGVEVRRFNTPRIDSPVGWLSRDHRKTLSVDGEVAFVTGVCVSRRWLGDAGSLSMDQCCCIDYADGFRQGVTRIVRHSAANGRRRIVARRRRLNQANIPAGAGLPQFRSRAFRKSASCPIRWPTVIVI